MMVRVLVSSLSVCVGLFGLVLKLKKCSYIRVSIY